MKLHTATQGDRVADTDAILTSADCKQLVSLGYAGVFRYLSDLTSTEVGTILTSGLALYFVNHSRAVGWLPSGPLGASDGDRDVADLVRLGIPKGVHVSFDLEGVGGGSATNTSSHVNAHAAAVQASGNLAAIYVGEGAILTSAQLYALRSTLYWHSCSRIEDAAGNEAGPSCGWAAYQLFEDDFVLPNGLVIDINSMALDFKRRAFVGVSA